MVGDFLQQQILKGNAEHIIKNVFDVTYNWNIGRNKNCIIEKIVIHPLVSDGYITIPYNEKTTEELENEINNFLNDIICTLRLYDGKTTQNFTFKLNNELTFGRYNINSGNDLMVLYVNSEPIELDVFWKFTGNNITFELFTAEDLFSSTFPSFGTATSVAPSKKPNPVGSNAPYLIERFVPPYQLANLGRKTESDPVLTTRLDEAIIPAEGDDILGNKFPIKGTGENFFDQSFPIISCGCVLYEPSKIGIDASC